MEAVASEYTDESYNMRTANGELCAFHTLYLCMMGSAQFPCATTTASAHWARLREDIFATGQEYYCCNVCGAHYKTPYGVIAELIVRNEVCFVKAPFPDQQRRAPPSRNDGAPKAGPTPGASSGGKGSPPQAPKAGRASFPFRFGETCRCYMQGGAAACDF